jgi:hypothetical protein
LSRVSKPLGVWGRVHEGKGRGWNFCTLTKPLPWPGVKGMYEEKNICRYHFILPKISEFFVYKKYF